MIKVSGRSEDRAKRGEREDTNRGHCEEKERRRVDGSVPTSRIRKTKIEDVKTHLVTIYAVVVVLLALREGRRKAMGQSSFGRRQRQAERAHLSPLVVRAAHLLSELGDRRNLGSRKLVSVAEDAAKRKAKSREGQHRVSSSKTFSTSRG